MPSLEALVTYEWLRSFRGLAWGADGEPIVMSVHDRVLSPASTDELARGP